MPATESRLKLTKHERQTYLHYPAEGTRYEDVLKPEYWVHVSAKLRPLDIIQVIPDEETYFAELLVRDVQPLAAKVQELRFVELEKVELDEAVATLYAVKWKGPAAKWCVIRLADKQVIADGYRSQGDAAQYARNMVPKAA